MHYWLAVALVATGILSACAQTTQQQRLYSVYFTSGSADLDSAAENNLRRVLDTLPHCASYRVMLYGHTDSVGDARYNQQLSRRRVAGVQRWLLREGVASTSAEALGESQPIERNEYEQGRQKNRRVDLLLYYHEKPVLPNAQPDTNRLAAWGLDSFSARMRWEGLRRPKQSFCLDPNREHWLVLQQGTLLYVPAGAFQLPKTCRDSCVRLSIGEAYDLPDLLVEGLNVGADGQLLELNGGVHLQAHDCKGKEIWLRPKAQIGVGLPIVHRAAQNHYELAAVAGVHKNETLRWRYVAEQDPYYDRMVLWWQCRSMLCGYRVGCCSQNSGLAGWWCRTWKRSTWVFHGGRTARLNKRLCGVQAVLDRMVLHQRAGNRAQSQARRQRLTERETRLHQRLYPEDSAQRAVLRQIRQQDLDCTKLFRRLGMVDARGRLRPDSVLYDSLSSLFRARFERRDASLNEVYQHFWGFAAPHAGWIADGRLQPQKPSKKTHETVVLNLAPSIYERYWLVCADQRLFFGAFLGESQLYFYHVPKQTRLILVGLRLTEHGYQSCILPLPDPQNPPAIRWESRSWDETRTALQAIWGGK